MLFRSKVDSVVLSQVEKFVNDAIKNGGEVTMVMMSKIDAEKDLTIEASFWERYPEEVKVYTIYDSDGVIISRELCGGPHVENLKTITGNFRIIKEESSASGVRRIKAILE